MKRWCLRLLLLPVFLLREIWRRLRAGSGNERLIRRAPYAGGPVAVVALYQDGKVRADILALLLSLRRRGVYVIAVNTGELDDAGARLPADCYLERSNYGRDFGSYRAGIRRATSLAEAHGQAPERLLLLNDSVFYVAAGLDEFLNRLLTSAADICSATESTEVLPHQTSFCLSFSRACLAHPAFARFWRRYVATDLRPLTVLLGEIALSRVLYRAGLSHAALAGRDMVRKIATGGAVPGRLRNGRLRAMPPTGRRNCCSISACRW